MDTIIGEYIEATIGIQTVVPILRHLGLATFTRG